MPELDPAISKRSASGGPRARYALVALAIVVVCFGALRWKEIYRVTAYRAHHHRPLGVEDRAFRYYEKRAAWLPGPPHIAPPQTCVPCLLDLCAICGESSSILAQPALDLDAPFECTCPRAHRRPTEEPTVGPVDLFTNPTSPISISGGSLGSPKPPK